MSLVLRNKGKGMQRSSEQPLVGEERYVTTLITAAKETTNKLHHQKKMMQRCNSFLKSPDYHYNCCSKQKSTAGLDQSLSELR